MLKNKQKATTAYLLIFIFLNALGFPGSYTRVFGSSFGMLIEYTSFVFQLYLMLSLSAEKFMDIKLINLSGNFFPIYLFIMVVTISSMLVTSDRGEQLISCLRLSVTIFFGIWVATNLEVKEILECLYYAQILFILASIAFPVLFHAYDYRTASYASSFVGISGVKNAVASEISFGLIMQALYWRVKVDNNERISFSFIIVFLMQCSVLILAQSTGALFKALIPSAYIAFFERPGKRLPLGIIYIVGSIAFIIGALTIIPIFEPLLNAIGKDATLTGRIPLWNQLINVMQRSHTFFGYGYGMFWRDKYAIAAFHAGFDEYSFMGNMTSGAHNNIIELWLNTGLVGAATFFTTVFFSLANIGKTDRVHYQFVAAYMLYYLINGWTERCWGTYEFGVMFLFITLGMSCLQQKEKEKGRIRYARHYRSHYYIPTEY